MSILSMLPGSADWMLGRLDLGAQLELRRELRRLQRALDARFASVWVVRHGTAIEVEFAGDHAGAPRPYPELSSTVPSFEVVLVADGEEQSAVVNRPRLGRGMPTLGLVIVDIVASPEVLDAVDGGSDRIEQIVIDALAR